MLTDKQLQWQDERNFQELNIKKEKEKIEKETGKLAESFLKYPQKDESVPESSSNQQQESVKTIESSLSYTGASITLQLQIVQNIVQRKGHFLQENNSQQHNFDD